MLFLRMAKNNKEKLFTYFKNLKFFFCLFLFILLFSFDLILNVNADSNVAGGGLPGYSIQSGSGVGYGSQQNYYDIYKSFGGLGTGIGGQFTDADLGAMEAYYVGGGYMTAEQFQAAAAAYVEANVDPQFEGSLEDFTVFLGDYVGVADLPRYEPTVPEYPVDSSSPPSAESIPANPVAPAARDQPTAVEGNALPAQTPPATETAAENSSVVQGNVSDGGVPVITGEDPTVAAALVSLEDGESNTTQSEVVFLGNQTQPETVQLGNQTQPETVYLGNQTKPETVQLGNQDQPETVYLGNQTQPETVQLGNQTQPETVELGNQTPPEVVYLGNQTQPDTILLGDQDQPDTIVLGNTTQPETVPVGDQTQPETIPVSNQTQPETVELDNETPPPAVCAGNGCGAAVVAQNQNNDSVYLPPTAEDDGPEDVSVVPSAGDGVVPESSESLPPSLPESAPGASSDETIPSASNAVVGEGGAVEDNPASAESAATYATVVDVADADTDAINKIGRAHV